MNKKYAEQSRQYSTREVNYPILINHLNENGHLLREHKNGALEWAIYFYSESAVSVSLETAKYRLKVTSATKEKAITVLGDLEKILLRKK